MKRAINILFVIIALAAGMIATPGDLDPTFSGDGKTVLAFGVGDGEGNATAIQADGKIVVAGWASQGSERRFALIRYDTDGSLDTSFDGDGKVLTDIVENLVDEIRAISIQSVSCTSGRSSRTALVTMPSGPQFSTERAVGALPSSTPPKNIPFTPTWHRASMWVRAGPWQPTSISSR